MCAESRFLVWVVVGVVVSTLGVRSVFSFFRCCRVVILCTDFQVEKSVFVSKSLSGDQVAVSECSLE